MADNVAVGQVAEWFKATVLKCHGLFGDKCRKARYSNKNKPRLTRRSRFVQRFAMALNPAQIAPHVPSKGNEGLTTTDHGRVDHG